MLSVRQLHQEIGNNLQSAGIEQPRREAALILSHFLGLSRAELYAGSEKNIDASQIRLIRAAGQRRAEHVPLAYLLGETEFSGLIFTVGPGVLIPRADSEILVEAGLDACRKMSARPIMILDICTGTGCIGISLYRHLQESGLPSRLWLTDLDPEAGAYARRNLIRHHLAEQGILEMTDLFPADPTLHWDLIVANPPYIASTVIATLMPEVRCHEPLTALDGGPDGLAFYRRLIAVAATRLTPGGCLLLEHGYDQAAAVGDLIHSSGQYDRIPAILDYGGQPRVSGGWRK